MKSTMKANMHKGEIMLKGKYVFRQDPEGYWCIGKVVGEDAQGRILVQPIGLETGKLLPKLVVVPPEEYGEPCEGCGVGCYFFSTRKQLDDYVDQYCSEDEENQLPAQQTSKDNVVHLPPNNTTKH